MTAAHLSAWVGHVASLSMLVNMSKSCLDVKDSFGQNPVHLAIWSGDEILIRYLHYVVKPPQFLSELIPNRRF